MALEVLRALGVEAYAYSKEIAGIVIDPKRADRSNISKSPLYMPDLEASAQAEDALMACMQEQDSAGGVIECVVHGMPVGVGEPVFDKLDAKLAQAVMSIGAVKGVEIGDGFLAAQSRGSQFNDSFVVHNGAVCTKTNHAGGILGGISDGCDIILRAAVKPTPSIASAQETIGRDGAEREIHIKGRHDPIIVPRAVVVVESMTAITLLDLLMMSMTSRLDRMQHYFGIDPE